MILEVSDKSTCGNDWSRSVYWLYLTRVHVEMIEVDQCIGCTIVILDVSDNKYVISVHVVVMFEIDQCVVCTIHYHMHTTWSSSVDCLYNYQCVVFFNYQCVVCTIISVLSVQLLEVDQCIGCTIVILQVSDKKYVISVHVVVMFERCLK